MPNKLPENVAKQVKVAAFRICDELDYCSRSRPDNAKLITQLVNHHDVGMIIQKFVKQDEVRTYIKDSILNKYAKEHVKAILHKAQIQDLLQKKYSLKLNKITDTIFATKGSPIRYIVAQIGTYLKWESALRKALEESINFKERCSASNSPEICLILAVFGNFTQGDREHLVRTLDSIQVKVIFVSDRR